MNKRITFLKDQSKKTKLNNWVIIEKLRMDAWKKFSNEKNQAIKRAKVFAFVLENIPIEIEEMQLFAGSLKPCFAPVYNLLKGGLEDFDGYCTYENLFDNLEINSRDKITSVKKFWLENADGYEVSLSKAFSNKEKEMMRDGIFFVEPVTGHSISNHSKVLAKGFNGLLEEIKIFKEKSKNKDYYLAMAIALGAAKSFAIRYSNLAEELAQKTSDAKRKNELMKLAEVCKKVPAQPAENLYEAIQSFWFTYVLQHIEQSPNPYAFSVGLLDRILGPYIKDETDEEILEFLESLFLLFNIGKKSWAISQNLCIGGLTEEGTYFRNKLTDLILKAASELVMPLPTITIRYHDSMPQDLLNNICSYMQKGFILTWVNDNIVIPSKELTGISPKDAVNFAIAGCQEPVIQGKENARTTASWLNLLSCLSLTINKGKFKSILDKTMKEYFEVEEITDYDSLLQAFNKQLDIILKIMTVASSKSDEILAEKRPVPFLSSIMDNCIEKGIDFRKDGAKYNFAGCLIHGLGDTADSLFTIKKLVFEQKIMTLEEFKNILNHNFENNESLRQMIINKLPKYGNDIEEIDNITKDLANLICEKISNYKTASGATFRPGFSTPSTHVLYGRLTPASASGRKDGQTLCYGINPMQGYNKEGISAAINSATKIDQIKTTHGLGFGVTLHPTVIQGEFGLKNIFSLIKTYFDKGGRYFQANIVDKTTLLNAQKNPEKYADLMIRVHGMSTYFVELDPLIQKDIIERCEAGL